MALISRTSAIAVFAVLALCTSDAGASPLPPPLQAQLIVKVAGYDKGLRARAGGIVRVVIVSKGSDDDEQWANELRAGFRRTETIGGLPHVETINRFATARDLARDIRSNQVAIVVLPASLGQDVEAVRSSLEGVDVLTVAPDGELVKQGIVLGIELVSGRPRLFFNASQATRQHVAMSADVMKLMKLVE